MNREHKPKRGLSVVMGIVAAVGLHGAIVAVVWMGRAQASTERQSSFAQGQVVDVQAVKFGKPRDLSFLPHKQMVVHDKGPKPKIALTENDKALPKLKDPNEKTPTDEDPLKKTHTFDTTSDEPEQKGVEEEGDPNGLKGGTSTVGKGPIYYQHLKAAVQNAWSVPTTISDSDLKKLEAQACFKIDAAGKVTEVAVSKPSRNDRFDATLLDALGKVKDTWSEAPTDDVKAAVTGEGVCFNFKGSEQR